MTTISAALQSLTSAAESSRDRSESDKAAIRRLEVELRTALIRTQPAESTPLSPAASARATDPLSPWSPAPHAVMLDELRLLRSEMEDAKRARQNTALIPEPAALPAPETSAAPPATKEHEAVKEQLEVVKLQAEVASLRAEVRDLNQEKQEVRRQVVKEMSEDWGALSDVIRSTLLEKNVSSPSAEKALDAAAAAAAAAAADKTKEADKAAGGRGQQVDDAAEAEVSGEPKDSGFSRDWSGEDWVASLDVHKLISSVLVARAGAGRHSHLTFVRTLAADKKNGRDAILSVSALHKLILDALPPRQPAYPSVHTARRSCCASAFSRS